MLFLVHCSYLGSHLQAERLCTRKASFLFSQPHSPGVLQIYLQIKLSCSGNCNIECHVERHHPCYHGSVKAQAGLLRWHLLTHTEVDAVPPAMPTPDSTQITIIKVTVTGADPYPAMGGITDRTASEGYTIHVRGESGGPEAFTVICPQTQVSYIHNTL